ncbi:hypothetical protein M4951_01175 [Blastopirellula sp. J2-11]|uniref:hypothetical protein n=1 Tax=Blastopirellula sp. J2-11 TaxID=2943192 RepID=UPI0021C805E5|nr:hypothetical protein [Blastopirellula sp. J2-11]UUO06937.1 hypothetical protein M4951_01175 [Blastopirellula sp. J2-11]
MDRSYTKVLVSIQQEDIFMVMTNLEGLAFDPASTPEIYLRFAEKKCGLPTGKAYTTPEALLLVELCGYDCDRPKLTYQLKKKFFKSPEKDETGKAYFWKRENVLDLIRSLESMRAWLPIHGFHCHKMRSDELQKGQDSIANQAAFVAELATRPSRELLSMLVTTLQEGNRKLIALVLHDRLGHLDDHLQRN